MSLATDTTLLNQPKDTYPFALNGIKSTVNEMRSFIGSEPGNTITSILPPNHKVIGSIYTNNELIIFSTDNLTSQIGRLKDGVYSVIMNDPKLNFTTSTYIVGEHRVKSGCDDLIYWSDGRNPDRYLNLSKPIPDDIELLSFASEKKHPVITINAVNNSGGNISSSSLRFALQYLDTELNVFYTSDPTPDKAVIYADANLPSATGSFNIENYDAETGGRPITNKSVDLTISNIDTKFDFLRLIIIQQEDGIYNSYQLDELIEINGQDTISYTFRGLTNQDIQIANSEVLVDNILYSRSTAMEQVQNRLVRANVTQVTKDYTNFQRRANEIVVRPVIEQIETNSSLPEYYRTATTFQSDEVYALGIRYIFEDGTKSPVFHIPGREAINDELDLINADHLGEGPHYRFLVENNGNTNQLGYYQTDSTYPLTKNCNDEYIYGDLAGQPIRHHLMPSRKTVPLTVDGKPNVIKLDFNNIIYPDPEIIDHEIMYVPRSRTNSTVLDSGYLISSEFTNTAGDQYTFNEFYASNFGDKEVFGFISPKSLLQETQNGNYFKPIELIRIDQLEEKGEFNTDNAEEIKIFARVTVQDTTESINQYFKYDDNVFISPSSINNTLIDGNITNQSYSQSLNVFKLSERSNLFKFGVVYAINKNQLIPYRVLSSLRYAKLSKTDTGYIGDAFISEFSPLNIRSLEAQGLLTGGLFDKDIIVRSENLRGLYVESIYNYNLFVDGTDCNTFYKNTKDLVSYVLNKVATPNGDEFKNRQFVCNEYYANNKSYQIDNFKTYFTLPLTYDYCDKCLDKQPNRIIFSLQSFSEELADYYLVNKTNDYIDLPGNRGEIINLKYKNNKLYVHTTETTFVLFPNPQFISTNEEVAQLTSGDFLSVPPNEIIQSDYGFGGMQFKLASIDTEYGYFWVDAKRGNVFRLTSELSTISNMGMTAFFRENLSKNSKTFFAYDPYFSRVLLTNHDTSLCKSKYTLSYSLLDEKFTSFHSYIPDIYLTDNLAFYSVKNNEIYKHLKDSRFTTYFNEKHPFIIEAVESNMQTKNLSSIYYYAEFFNNNQEIDDIYTNVIAYNNNQSSGLLTLIKNNPYNNIALSPAVRTVATPDKTHKISKLYDNATSKQVFNKSCLPDTDKEFINTSLDNNFYTKQLFREKYIATRFYYSPEQDNQVIHYLNYFNQTDSIR